MQFREFNFCEKAFSFYPLKNVTVHGKTYLDACDD